MNKVDDNNLSSVYEFLRTNDLEVLGVIPFDENLKNNSVSKDSECVEQAIKEFYFRLNLPQIKQ